MCGVMRNIIQLFLVMNTAITSKKFFALAAEYIHKLFKTLDEQLGDNKEHVYSKASFSTDRTPPALASEPARV